MDSKCFCVFWFPTIFHCEKKHKNPKFFISIADDDDKKDLKLEIKEEQHIDDSEGEDGVASKNEKKFDLVFTLTDQNGRKIESRFSCVDQTRNGFVVYSYDRIKLIDDYWNRFDDNEQKRILDNSRHRVINRIKKKYPNTKDPNPDDVLIKNYTIDRILISFYHNAKLFYHEHETHKDSDARLRAYYYTKELEDGSREYLVDIPSLVTKNNPVINWYIDQFEKQLVGNAENISVHHKRWSKDLEDTFDFKDRVTKAVSGNNTKDILMLIGEIRSKNQCVESSKDSPPDIIDIDEIRKEFKDDESAKDCLTKLYQDSLANYINKLYEGLSALSKECTDSLIEYTYCKTLLESKYNEDYKHNYTFSDKDFNSLINKDPELLERDSRRKKAFNIRNSIRYIESIRQKCDFWGIRITEMLMEEVHGITENHRELLKDIRSLTNANNKTLEESEKSNENSSFLGWLSVSLAIFSLGGLEPDCCIWKFGCFTTAFVMFVVYNIIHEIKKRNNSSK